MRFIVMFSLLAVPLQAFANENYVCFLNKFMEVSNDGRFFGPEATEIKMKISVKEYDVDPVVIGPQSPECYSRNIVSGCLCLE